MTQTAEVAFRKLVALKDLTRTTGTVTTRAQKTLLRSLDDETLAEVAVAFRELNQRGVCETDSTLDVELAEATEAR